MHRRRVLTIAVAAALVARLSASCIDFDALGNGPPRGVTVEPPPVDPCAHVTVVSAPGSDDAPGEELPPFELAVDQVTIDPEVVAGFDLDGICTCDTRPGALADGGPGCRAPSTTCDLDGGADNVAGIIARSQGILDINRSPNALIAAGARTLLVQVTKYNGRANDPEIEVGAFPAEAITASGCDASVLDPTTQVWTPGRCGEDSWTLTPAGVLEVGSRKRALSAGSGYVRDHRLVVRFSSAVAVPYGAGTTLRYLSAVLTGTLVPLGVDLLPRDPARAPTTAEQRLFRIDDAVLAGRLVPGDVLSTLGSFVTAGGTLCELAAFATVRSIICDAVDVRQTEGPISSEPCDALSSALGLVLVPARAGDVSDAGVVPAPCPAESITCP